MTQANSRERSMRVVHRFLDIELLWNWTQDRGFRGYDMYFLLREDLYFVDDVNMNRFPDPGSVYSSVFGTLCSMADAGAVNAGICNDRAVVFGGDIAGSLMNFYTEFIHNPNPRFNNLDSPEDFMQRVAQAKGV